MLQHRRALVALSVSAALVSLSGCATLVSASRGGDADEVAKMLAKGANPNEAEDGTTPLCAATRAGNARIAEMLLEKGAAANGTCDAQPVLCTASADVAKVLVAHRADVNSKCDSRKSVLEKAMLANDAQKTALLVEAGADPNTKAMHESYSNPIGLLAVVAASYDLEKAHETKQIDGAAAADAFLGAVTTKHGAEKAHALVNEKDGIQPFGTAVLRANEKLARVLLRHGADVNACQNAPGLGAIASPLLLAVASAEYDRQIAERVAGLLKKSGARIEADCWKEKTPHAVLAEWSKEREHSRAQEREWQAIQREMNNRPKAPSAGASFMAGFARGLGVDIPGSGAGGGSGGGTSSNPLDDNSFQEKMKNLASQPSPPTRATGSDADERRAEPTPSASSTRPSTTSAAPRPPSATPADPKPAAAPAVLDAPRETSKPDKTPRKEEERTVLAVGIAFRRAEGGCVRGEIASFGERTLEGDWSTEYSAFKREIFDAHPFGNGKPYDGFPVTAFVRPGRVAVIASFEGKPQSSGCVNKSYYFQEGATYEEAWAAVQKQAREWKWASFELARRWPTPEIDGNAR